ncbi:MAG: efflux RND transporter periplasmic adaptor subunit [Candidatus Staskawiczbacteria bacterium]|nr:efflux RND transporter periplasmic adaptor subunit [Candidatus Staskawiczbacteria bacterium]
MKIKKSWIVIIIIILLLVGYFFIKPLFKSPTDGLVTEKIVKGEVLQEVSETGSVKATEDVGLGFKSIGKVSKINVEVGDKVKKGDILASLDASQVLAQLQSAKSALDYTTSQYDSGVSSARDDLRSAYNSALNVLNDTYTKIYNSYNAVVDLQNTYFLTTDQEGIEVLNSKNDIQKKMSDVKSYLDLVQANSNSAIDSAVSVVLTDLDSIYNDLKIIRAQCDSGIYYNNVSSTSKISIDTQKTNINTAITNLTASQTSISSYKIALQKAEDSTVEQAQADVDSLQSQLNDNYLASPIDGIITQVNIKKGQVASPTQTAINMLSTEPFQVKVAIYEQDVVNVKVGDATKVNLVAFPKQTFLGKVLSIDPAETIIDNVVYYKVTIEFPNQPDGIKSGMTADITIETNKAENVLRIPKNAVLQTNGTQTVQIAKNGQIQNVTITTGLEGNDYFEVLSGLKEGDEIITGKK